MHQSQGWALLAKYADGQIKARQAQVNAPLNSLLEVGLREYYKGEMAGIGLFLRMPELAMSAAESDLRLIEPKLKELDEDENW